MATFVVGVTTASFGAMIEGHEDKGGGGSALREIECDVHFSSEVQFNTLRDISNWDVEVIPIPWGNTIEILVRGGAGVGTLTINGLTPPSYTAYLVSVSRHKMLRGGHSIGRAHWIIESAL